MKLTDRQAVVLGIVFLVVLIPAVIVLNVWWIRHTWN